MTHLTTFRHSPPKFDMFARNALQVIYLLILFIASGCSMDDKVPEFVRVGGEYKALIEGEAPKRFKVLEIDHQRGWIKAQGVYGNNYWIDISKTTVLKDTNEP